MEMVELLGMALVDCPGLACVQQCREDDAWYTFSLVGRLMPLLFQTLV